MDFFELTAKRRSCRKFSERQPDRATIEKIVEATLTAPSSKNTRSTRLLVVEQREVIERMASMRDYGSAFLSGAPTAIVVMGDKEVTDLWEVNCSISATFLQLAAEAAGLGSCWVHVDGRPRLREEPEGESAEEYLRSFLPIPESCGVLCVVALGYSGYSEERPRTVEKNEGAVTYL